MSQVPCRVEAGNLAFSRDATGESNLPSCCEGILGVPYESAQGYQALAQVEEDLGVLSKFRWQEQWASSRVSRGRPASS